jgi:hypothetical protein
MASLADAVDSLLTPFSAGVKASRPAASGTTRFYFATDEETLYLSDGSDWYGLTGEPVGTIRTYAGASPYPNGWAECDGSEVSRTANPDLNSLFSAAGYPFGNGNGSSTMNLPNLVGRVAVGAGGSYGLGSSGGAEEVTLAANEIGEHTHSDGTYYGASHYHGLGGHTHYVSGNISLTADHGAGCSRVRLRSPARTAETATRCQRRVTLTRSVYGPAPRAPRRIGRGISASAARAAE